MNRIFRYAGQAAVYAAAAAIIGYFSQAPAYRAFPEDTARIRLSFQHGGERLVDCRRRTSAEIAKLAPNMRKPMDCQRERVPLYVELTIDGTVRYQRTLPPTGLSGDGPSKVYERIDIPAGPHRLDLRLRDSKRETGFDYEKTFTMSLAANQSIAIDFRSEAGGFIIR